MNSCFRHALITAFLLAQSWLHAELTETKAEIFQGICHIRCEQTEPEKQVSHIVEIDLKAPHLRFMTTPGNGPEFPRETECETTQSFVKRLGAQLGINGNFFINDQEPHTELLGLAVSNGEVVSPWDEGWAKYAVNIAQDNTVAFVERAENGSGTPRTNPKVNLYNALSGNLMLVRGGKIQVPEEGDRHPRTGIGKTADNKLLLLIADGRQPDFSVGMTYYEMAQTLIRYAAVEALALDGGGSTTLVIAGPDPEVVNVPMPIETPGGFNVGPPGIERKNGNNLAVFAAPLQENAGKPASRP
jgi:hypothetical protein